MNELELERLYLLYKSGAVADKNPNTPASRRADNSDLLQVAKAVANDLTMEEFKYISQQVFDLHDERDKRFEEAIPEKDESGNPIIKQTNSMPQREFQERLWSIADTSFPRPFALEKLSPTDVRKQFAEEAIEQSTPKETDQRPLLSQIASMLRGNRSPERETKAPPVIKTSSGEMINKPVKDGVVRSAEVWKEIASPVAKQGGSSTIKLDGKADQAEPDRPSVSGAVASKGIQLEPIDRKAFWQSVVQQASVPMGESNQQPSGANTPAMGPQQQSSLSGLLDGLQTVLDAVGVADPTPIADGANVVISLARAVMDPKRSGEHLANAGVSAVSMVPYIGDIAKAFKYGGKGAKVAADGAQAVKHGHMGPQLGHQPQLAGGHGGNGGGHAIDGIASIFGGGGGGSGGGGQSGSAAAGGGGFDFTKWSMIGGAIALAAHEVWSRMQSFGKFAQPSQYRGNAFDAVTETMDKGRSLYDASTPTFMKFTSLGWSIDLAIGSIKGWVDWLKRTEEAGNAMLESQKHLAQYNGQIAMSLTSLEVDRVLRDIGKAEAMGGNYEQLTESQTNFEAAKQDLLQPFEQLQMLFQSKMLDFGTWIMKGLDRLESIDKMVERWFGKATSDESRSALTESIRIQAEKQRNKL